MPNCLLHSVLNISLVGAKVFQWYGHLTVKDWKASPNPFQTPMSDTNESTFPVLHQTNLLRLLPKFFQSMAVEFDLIDLSTG